VWSPLRASNEGWSSGLSRLSGWSDRKFIQKNQTDQKDQPTRQTNPGALREHRRLSGSIPSSAPRARRAPCRSSLILPAAEFLAAFLALAGASQTIHLDVSCANCSLNDDFCESSSYCVPKECHESHPGLFWAFGTVDG
jgi:hypothetical protein